MICGCQGAAIDLWETGEVGCLLTHTWRKALSKMCFWSYSTAPLTASCNLIEQTTPHTVSVVCWNSLGVHTDHTTSQAGIAD